jgi:HSP20 family protein
MNLLRFQRPSWPWGGFEDLGDLQKEINRLFEGGLSRTGLDVFNHWAPPVDLFEEKDSFVVKAELPGLRKEDIDISYQDGALTVSGERKEEKREGSNPARTERFFGRFQRTVSLPKQVDAGKIKASYKDGVLSISLPKAEEAKPKQIEVHVG